MELVIHPNSHKPAPIVGPEWMNGTEAIGGIVGQTLNLPYELSKGGG